jgi:Eukaryotic aspartyl protease
MLIVSKKDSLIRNRILGMSQSHLEYSNYLSNLKKNKIIDELSWSLVIDNEDDDNCKLILGGFDSALADVNKPVAKLPFLSGNLFRVKMDNIKIGAVFLENISVFNPFLNF